MTERGAKIHAALLAKYGSEYAVFKKRQEWGRKGNKAAGGFASMTPERRKEVSKLGHAAFIASIRGRHE